MRLLVKGTTQPLHGEVLVPNSKYHAHRALILASLVPGTSRILGLSDARHVEFTVAALRALGTRIEIDGDTFVVSGGPYHPARRTISVGSSGTTLYFMIGLASLAASPVTITAQKYFLRRPVGPLLDSLRQMGLRIESAPRGCPPITVAARRPRGGRVIVPGTLSQWISGLLLLAPFAQERTIVEVEGPLNERPYVQLTVRMMAKFGLHVEVKDDWRRYEIEPGQQPQAATVALPPDIGSAAFGLAAAALHPADVLLRGLGAAHDHPEAGFMDVIREMGLPFEVDAAAQAVRVRHQGVRLHGVRVDCREIPDMLPILSTLAAFAEGETVLENVAHIRLKESDRVAAMLQLNRMGGKLEIKGDRLVVQGTERLRGATLSSYNDHRVLMSLAVAASRAEGQTTLTYPNAYRISYPMFLESMKTIGIPMSIDALPSGPRPRRRSATQTVPAPKRAAKLVASDLLLRWAQDHPSETAVVDVRDELTTAWTWQELHEQVDRTASLLLALGVQPGECVAFQLPNWSEFVVISLAALRIGAVCCPLMPIFREREMAFMLERARARVVFIPDEFRSRPYTASMAEIAAGLPRLEHVIVVPAGRQAHPFQAPSGRARWHRYHEVLRGILVDSAALDARRPKPAALAQLLFTSGTSGEPKGVLHRNDVLMRAAAMQALHLRLNGSDRIYIPSPLAHQTGFLYGMWLALLLGVPQILQDIWNPQLALRALREWGGTFVQAATPFLADLVKQVDAGSAPPNALRVFVATGAAVPRVLAQ
ncbi:MAG: 3-phosphoshikimate 1-carboxyvinyltransferase, partial [bacterium]|nr:3-phosphoshikimate 1-carboxyvinyltransferase [bacterium]